VITLRKSIVKLLEPKCILEDIQAVSGSPVLKISKRPIAKN
jgi:hypothetical protein